MVAVAAGFPGGSKDLPTNGIPNNCCLQWLCFRKCGFDRCTRDHPTMVDNAASVNKNASYIEALLGKKLIRSKIYFLCTFFLHPPSYINFF
jgi:hypothetical protein